MQSAATAVVLFLLSGFAVCAAEDVERITIGQSSIEFEYTYNHILIVLFIFFLSARTGYLIITYLSISVFNYLSVI